MYILYDLDCICFFYSAFSHSPIITSIKFNNTQYAFIIFFAYINVNQCGKCSTLYHYFHNFPLTNCLAFARVGRVCFTCFLSQTSLPLLRWYRNSLQLLARHKVFEKGTFLCIHPVFFFYVVLSKLSSSPSTLDRHFTIYLQREQFLSCRLPANNVKEHTGGNLCLHPQSQKCACTVMTQRSVLSNPQSAASFRNGNQPVPPFSRHPSVQKQRSPRHCPHALPERSPLCLQQKQFLRNEEVFIQFKHFYNPRSQ